MTISKQVPLFQKSNNYIWRGISPTGATAAATIPVCTNGYFIASTDALDNSRKIAYVKRPGAMDFEYVTGHTNLKTTNAGERVKGLVTNLDKTQVLFFTQDATKRYSNIFNTSGNTLTQTDISTSFSAGFYAMTQLDNVNYGSNVAYAANNGTDGALINSTGVWSKITDADFTGTGVKTNFIGLDGYLFYGVISGTGAGRIYNSDLSAAAAASGWVATSYISSLEVPGNIVWLAKARNLIVCFKQYSIEFFENVGAPTPGSPLQVRKNLTKRVGCASASSIQEVSDGIIFLGINALGKLKYYKLERDSLELKDISDAQLEAALNTSFASSAGFRSYSTDYAVDSTNKGQSQVINFQDKELYAAIIPAALDGTAITYVYDNELDIWVRWSTAFGTTATMDGTFIPSMSFLLNNNNGGYLTCFVNNYASNTKSRFNVFISISTSANATLSSKCFSDQYELATTNIHNFVFSWLSDFIDLGTGDRKFLHLVEVFYDSDPDQSAASATTFTLSFQHYEKDYNLSMGGTRTCTIDNAGHRRAVFRKLGQYRRKAFKLLDYSNYPLRIWAVELVYSGGPEIYA